MKRYYRCYILEFAIFYWGNSSDQKIKILIYKYFDCKFFFAHGKLYFFINFRPTTSIFLTGDFFLKSFLSLRIFFLQLLYWKNNFSMFFKKADSSCIVFQELVVFKLVSPPHPPTPPHDPSLNRVHESLFFYENLCSTQSYPTFQGEMNVRQSLISFVNSFEILFVFDPLRYLLSSYKLFSQEISLDIVIYSPSFVFFLWRIIRSSQPSTNNIVQTINAIITLLGSNLSQCKGALGAFCRRNVMC